MAEDDGKSLSTNNIIRLLKENDFRFSRNCTGVARDLNVSLEERAQRLSALHLDSDYSTCFEECIDYWLRNDPSPSWGTLINVISKYDRNTARNMKTYLNIQQVMITHAVSVDSSTTSSTMVDPAPSEATATSIDTTRQGDLADLLKTMTLQDAQQIEISCKVFNADSNLIIQSTEPPLTRDIKIVRRQKSCQQLVKIGTSIRIEISADSNCYLYIINIGTSGKTSMLLPNEYETENYFRANQVYHLPDEDCGFEISGPPGKETIQVLAFSTRQQMLDRFIKEGTMNDKELYRDITIKRKKNIPSERKGFAQVQFDVKL